MIIFSSVFCIFLAMSMSKSECVKLYVLYQHLLCNENYPAETADKNITNIVHYYQCSSVTFELSRNLCACALTL